MPTHVKGDFFNVQCLTITYNISMVETSRQTNKYETIVEVNDYVHDGWMKMTVMCMMDG